MQARILVVDDDEHSRKLMRAILSPMGCFVSEAENGQKALREIEFGRWDAVLLDVNMPGMDGFEALRRIREKHSMEEVPVIMVTGSDDSEARQKALGLGANDFLGKPVDQPELMARVGCALSMRKTRLELEESVGDLAKLREWKQTVLGALAHDMRGLLQAMLRELDALDKASAGGAGSLGRALASLKRAVALTESMLEVSDAKSRRVSPGREKSPTSG